MEFYEFGEGRRFDRRIGRRSLTGPIDVRWVVPARGLLRRARTYPGRIEEVSLTGLAITGPAKLPVEIGATVLVRYEGGDSSVIVRRSQPTDVFGLGRYGVELVVVHPELRRELESLPPHPEGDDTGPTRPSAPRGFGGSGGPGVGSGSDPLVDAPAGPADDAGPEAAPEADAPRAAVEPEPRAPRASAADADEGSDLVEDLRRFMED